MKRPMCLLPWFVLLGAQSGALLGQSPPPVPYLPTRDDWQHREPAAVGMDAAKLAAAIAFAQQHPTDWPDDFSTQERIFGEKLGPLPAKRGGSSAVVVRHGYVVATFGDIEHVDPTYSVAKSLLATVTGVAVREHRLDDLDEPVEKRVTDGGYDSEHDKLVTWRQHLHQESEWQGEMWGKRDDFVGKAAFGEGERKPRALQAPGSHWEYNDVRINRLALSLLRVLDKPVPEVLRAEIMDPIGASATWQWVPYRESFVEQHGMRMPSVSGGTRWGGGVWISALDLARFGLLWLHRGVWGERRLLPEAYVAEALTPCEHGPDYGYLWWLNTKQKNFPGLPANCFAARGAGNNTVFVSPDHDLVIVWRWHDGSDHADAKFFAMVTAAIVE